MTKFAKDPAEYVKVFIKKIIKSSLLISIDIEAEKCWKFSWNNFE